MCYNNVVSCLTALLTIVYYGFCYLCSAYGVIFDLVALQCIAEIDF